MNITTEFKALSDLVVNLATADGDRAAQLIEQLQDGSINLPSTDCITHAGELLSELKESMTPDLYYLQDSRDTSDGKAVWWRKDCAGYTTDIAKAETFTELEATRANANRKTDIPWPVDYVRAKAEQSVMLLEIHYPTAMQNSALDINRFRE